jgi:DNA (cytosine-5)-methyltransferase 1
MSVDLICGGFPCQDLSVAGRRAGLRGERSGLFFEFARIAQTLRPTWLLIENVPGLLTSAKGHDFAVIVDTLADIGYGLAWRILDSQYFGVPQRRRRVYIVGHLGAPCPPEILFEPEGGGGDTATGGEQGPAVAFAVRTSAERCMWDGADNLIVQALAARDWRSTKAGDPLVCAPPDPDGVRVTPKFSCGLDPCSRCPDGRRYAALGDAVTVNVVEWIGRRLIEAALGRKA